MKRLLITIAWLLAAPVAVVIGVVVALSLRFVLIGAGVLLVAWGLHITIKDKRMDKNHE